MKQKNVPQSQLFFFHTRYSCIRSSFAWILFYFYSFYDNISNRMYVHNIYTMHIFTCIIHRYMELVIHLQDLYISFCNVYVIGVIFVSAGRPQFYTVHRIVCWHVSVYLRRRSGRGRRRPVWPLIWAGHHRDPPTEHRPQRRPLLPAVVSGVSINWPDSLV